MSTKTTLIQKVATALSKVPGYEALIKEIKEFKLSLETAAPIIAVALKEAKTKDGKVISYKGEKLDKSVAVFEVKDGVETPLADGDYVMEDGSTIMVAGGLIADIKAADPNPTPEQAMAVAMSKHKTEVEALFETKFKANNESLIKKVDSLTASNTELKTLTEKLLKLTQDILTIPVEDAPTVTSKDYNDMTALEKRKHDRAIKS
jgi:hypothetical protein